MADKYWFKQTAEAPLYPDMQWSQPQNKRQAGKLLVIGGNLHGFNAPASAYNEAVKAGVGTCRVILPNALYKTVAKLFPAAEYAPSTPVSGGFAKSALAEWLAGAVWSDGVLLAGDLGRNSETAVLFENFLDKYSGPLVVASDTVDYCLHAPTGCLDRPDTTMVLDITQLQKLALGAKFTSAFTSSMDLLQLVDRLHKFSLQHSCNMVVSHLGNTLVAAGGEISSTKAATTPDLANLAASAAVWWLQNPTEPFKALTTAVL